MSLTNEFGYSIGGIGGSVSAKVTFTGSEVIDVNRVIPHTVSNTFAVIIPVSPANVKFLFIAATGALTVASTGGTNTKLTAISSSYPVIWGYDMNPDWLLLGDGSVPQTLTFTNAGASNVTLSVKMLIDSTPA
jgi:hypothetical protein